MFTEVVHVREANYKIDRIHRIKLNNGIQDEISLVISDDSNYFHISHITLKSSHLQLN